MRFVSPLLLALALVPACLAQKPGTARYENLPGVPLYNHGYLLSWDRPYFTQFTLYGRNGKPAFHVPQGMDTSWAVDSDGIAAGAYQLPHLPEGRIDLLNSGGNVTGAINTGCYIPQQVVFAPDHTIWTTSYNAKNDGTQDFNVLHHYARTGEELGQALHWSEIAADLNHPVIETVRGGQLLFVANDRLGWNATLHRGPRTWVEVSLSGALLGKYELKTPDGLALWPIAMTASGNVYAQTLSRVAPARLAILDRSKGVWQKVVGEPGVIGSEGDNLVFLNLEETSATLIFAPSSSLRVEELQQ